MKITILGCGGAGGVPLIGNNWGKCDPNNPKNCRTCCSVKIEEGDKTFLIDTSPDMRHQLNKAGITDLTAIFYTHEHADHTHGIDNIRTINWLTGHAIPLYADAETMAILKRRFDYIFAQPPKTANFVCPSVVPHIIDGPLDIGDVHIESFLQQHGASKSRGYRFNDFAYSTDVSDLDEMAFDILKGVKVWVVGAIRMEPHTHHAHLEKALEWIKRVGPERAYLTHMNHTMDYDTLMNILPKGIEPAFDGLEIEV